MVRLLDRHWLSYRDIGPIRLDYPDNYDAAIQASSEGYNDALFTLSLKPFELELQAMGPERAAKARKLAREMWDAVRGPKGARH